MDKHRQIAFILAFILALLIMMVGKACTDSTMKKHNRPAQNTTQQSVSASDFNNSHNGYNNTPSQTTTTTPVQTTQPVVYVTNMLGEIVGTESAETVTEIQTTTEKFSILDDYNAGKSQNDKSIPAQNIYQTPSKVHITIR
ncbi:MAG: hypothetical protein K2J39_02545 [Ruminococcus sp.]|nr:hypothetical protein [Ruminococcus sp.]